MSDERKDLRIKLLELGGSISACWDKSTVGKFDQARAEREVDAATDAVLAAGYRRPRTVTTAAEMDALRFFAVVLDAYGTPYVCERHATDGSRNEWRPAGMNHLDQSEDILFHGDATVVYEGEPEPGSKP